jgi:hypothetical protein
MKLRVLGLALALAGAAVVPASAQKIKYKDLYVLLVAKKYSDAEPFLKTYLKQEPENPNAWLYLGFIYQDKSGRIDILKQTELLERVLDSAVTAYDKAFKMIDDKELKKNGEYYEVYNRRDLRTGEFGVKLSDVQYDVEKRLAALKVKKDKARVLKHHFATTEKNYARAQEGFRAVQAAFPGQKELYLRAEQKDITSLYHIAAYYDTCLRAFTQYRSVLEEIEKPGYDQELDKQEIKDFKHDGTTAYNFYENNLKIWEYGTWAESTIKVLERDVRPLKESLLAYDIELNKLREKLKTDSVSVKNDLTKVVDKLMASQLRKIDPDPMPLELFGIKVAELAYGSDRAEHKRHGDTVNLEIRIAELNEMMKDAHRLDSLVDKMESRNLDEEVLNYKQFVTTLFSSPAIFKTYLRGTREYAHREVSHLQREIDAIHEQLRWLYVDNVKVPLFMDAASDNPYLPLVVSERFWAGLHYKDALATGYLFSITPSRKPDLKVVFPVDSSAFALRHRAGAKALMVSDPAGNVHHILTYSTEKVGEGFRATITKIYRTEGLAWSYNVTFDMAPRDFTLRADTGEIVVYTGPSDAEGRKTVFDKTGRQVAQ